MSLFKRKKPQNSVMPVGGFSPSGPNPFNMTSPGSVGTTNFGTTVAPATADLDRQKSLALVALSNIHDGVIMTNRLGVIEFINPAAITMTGCGSAENALGLDSGLLIKLQSKEGRELEAPENPFLQVMRTGQLLDKFQCCLVPADSAKCIPISLSVLPVEGGDSRIVTFRDITKELIEEGEQAEFISTASHEMRTPVATIDGYISLALNPQTATIDDRARGYLDSAHNASQHLGRLFQDLLDVTKLDDSRLRPHPVPVELVGAVKQIADEYIPRSAEAKVHFQFGAGSPSSDNRLRLEQVVYGYVDLDFLREIVGNLIDNALKYTPEGGSVYVNVHGDGDRALINVTDTGIGISSDDLQHIFQKFYRVDNSDTRTIGGTGLGLYIVKQRVEALGGRVWAESAFGEGTTFYVSLPRLSGEEYEKRMIAVQNEKMIENIAPTPIEAPPEPVPEAPPTPEPIPEAPSTPEPSGTPPATIFPPASEPIITNNQGETI